MDRDAGELSPPTVPEVPTAVGGAIRAKGERVLLCAVVEDAGPAERLAAGLTGRGFDVETRLLEVEDLEHDGFAALERAVRASDFVVVLLSTRSVPVPSKPVPVIAGLFRMVSGLRAYGLYLIPVRLEVRDYGDVGARSLEVIDMAPDPHEGELTLARVMVASYGRWDLESRHYIILGFGTIFLVSIGLLVTLVLPSLIRADRPIRSLLLATGSIVFWLYPTFLASAWAGNRLGEWARRRRLEREWAWRGFAALWATIATLLLLL
jgi:hypothetical protein